MTKRIRILIRHAQSLANRGEPTGGDVAKISISDRGRLDAEKFAASLDFEGMPDLLVCSENLRSQQTVEIIQTTRYPSVPIETWRGIQEFHFLSFGQELTTPTQRRPFVDQYFNECNPYRRDPGAESWIDLYERCVALNEKLASHPANKLLLVTHGYLMITLLTLRDLNFPPVSAELMKLVHSNQLAKPIQNLQSVALEYPLISIENSQARYA